MKLVQLAKESSHNISEKVCLLFRRVQLINFQSHAMPLVRTLSRTTLILIGVVLITSDSFAFLKLYQEMCDKLCNENCAMLKGGVGGSCQGNLCLCIVPQTTVNPNATAAPTTPRPPLDTKLDFSGTDPLFIFKTSDGDVAIAKIGLRWTKWFLPGFVRNKLRHY